jgi:hypothetical protein
MQLADEHIAEFQMLYRKHFGQDISTEEALEKGLRLIRLIEVVLKSDAKMNATKDAPPPITN